MEVWAGVRGFIVGLVTTVAAGGAFIGAAVLITFHDLVQDFGSGFAIAYSCLIITLVLVGPLVARLLRLSKPWWFAAPAMIGVAGVAMLASESVTISTNTGKTTYWLGGHLPSRYVHFEHVLGLTVIGMITAHIALAVLVTKRAARLADESQKWSFTAGPA